MAGGTSIEWTDETWNPIVGCDIVSPGCTNCYAMRMAARLEAMGVEHYAGMTRKVNGHSVWTGTIRSAPESILAAPLRWKRPRRIFVNSMSDLFHEDVPGAAIDQVFAVMALAPQHTFQVLTKRAGRMRMYLTEVDRERELSIADAIKTLARALHPLDLVARDNMIWRAPYGGCEPMLPLPNVWLGVSVEDQPRADERIHELLATPAAKRFISAEPLLGLIDIARFVPELLTPITEQVGAYAASGHEYLGTPIGLDWVIAGGESGPGARPMHPDWPRALRDQCAAAGVAFFFKQWGEWAPVSGRPGVVMASSDVAWPDGTIGRGSADLNGGLGVGISHVGKKTAGARLDGVEHRAFPA
jgi:protein gp37